MSFLLHKQAEIKLQQAIQPLGYTVSIEPIDGTDIYYSDGSAAYSQSKAVFKNTTKEFLVFLPDLYCAFGIPTPIRDALLIWLKEVFFV
jgi:hypothetical protein